MSKNTNIPQKIDMDDGSFPLAHTALLTLAKTKISGAQYAIVNVIFTQTYGYHNEESPHKERIKKRHTRAKISHDFFMQVTWMGKQEVSRAINVLLKWGIIKRDKNTSPYTYWFNVYTNEWSPECWRASRIANSKQDSEQLANQRTKCSQDSEQTVSRIANSKQTSALEPQSLAEPLKKYIKKYKEIYIDDDDDDNNARARARTTDEPKKADNVPAIIVSFEGEFGRPLSPMEVQHIREWAREFTDEMLLEALKRASLAGRPTVAYIRGILTNWKKNNVRTLRDVAEMDKQFRARDKPKRSPPEPLVVDYEAAKNSKYGW